MERPDVERAMRELAGATDASRLPDAEVVWQRASALARYAQAEKATRPIRIVEWAACTLCGAAAIGSTVALLPQLDAAWGRLLVSAMATLTVAAVVMAEGVRADGYDS